MSQAKMVKATLRALMIGKSLCTCLKTRAFWSRFARG